MKNIGLIMSKTINLKLSDNSQLKYRLLWTWDRWIAKRNEKSFLTNYKKLIDFMSRVGLNGLIIWGFLDDKHGGKRAAQEICLYGKEKNVRIIPGIGIYSYGGVWCRGNHKYNLDTYIKKYPERGAIFPKDSKYSSPDDIPLPEGIPRAIACPSKKENFEWMKEGIIWLCKNFDIGGINFETGDNGICCCRECKNIRNRKDRQNYSFYDMGRILPEFCKIVHQCLPDAWIIYATYTNYWTPSKTLLNQLKKIPEYSIAQWNLTSFHDLYYPHKEKPPTKHNIGMCKYIGSSHFNILYTPTYPEYSYRGFHPFIKSISTFCKTAKKEGLEGVVAQGSGLPTMPDNEINYIALSKFSITPKMKIKEFIENEVSKYYGKSIANEVSNIFFNLEKIDEKVRYYFFCFAPLFGVKTGRLDGKWKEIRDIKEAIEDCKKLGIIIKKAIIQLNNILKQSNKFGKIRLRKIIKILNEEYYLFSTLYPELLQIYQADKEARTMKNLSEAIKIKKDNLIKLKNLSARIEKSPIDKKVYSFKLAIRRCKTQI